MKIRVEKDLIDSLDYRTLKEVRDEFDELIKEYGADARFNVEKAYYPYDSDSYIRQFITYEREETPEEREERVAKEKKIQEELKRRELEHLKKLKEKYPDKA